MDAQERRRGLARLLAETARAHHEATGGANDDWALWYAQHMQGAVDEFVGYSPEVGDLAGWLNDADQRQRADDPDGRWPSFYARYILDNFVG